MLMKCLYLIYFYFSVTGVEGSIDFFEPHVFFLYLLPP